MGNTDRCPKTNWREIMPSILLINENKIVSRLLQLSSEKNGYNLEEVSTLDGTSGDSYDVIFIDGDKHSDALMGQIESKLNYDQLGYIGSKQETVPTGFDLVIEKPFLPTDFVDMIKEKVIGRDVDTTPEEIEGFDLDDETDVLLEEDNLELEDINEGIDQLLESDELLESDALEDDISLISLDDLDDVDLSLDPATMMTTGVAASMAISDNGTEELAEMVSEIDLMEVDDLADDLLDELSTEQEEPKEDIDTLAAVGVGAAAIGAIASQALETEDMPEVLEDIQEEIATLDDIDDLSEVDLQEALGEEVVEEIISDEIIAEGEETLVESNDVEQWIRDAVAKAITPQMIKEALDGIDVNVTFSFNSKKDS